MLARLAAVAAVCVASVAARKYNTTSKRLAGVVNVHLVPHTHDDVGWLKTVDQYYYGNENQIQRAVVQNILNSMVKELAWNPDRKFIYVEQAFFQRWWEENSDGPAGPVVRQLVANGQLEFINGGWCMHDEANPTYVDMIDQTTLGHRLLLQQFNVTPKATWQIDPFGHSTFQAAMMSSPIAGYNSVFFARSDYQDVQNRNNQRTSEYVWAPSPSLGMNGATYAGILYGGYCTIGGIGMDVGSNDSPIMDDLTLEDYNVGQVVEGVVGAVMDAVRKYPQGDQITEADVLLPLGCDFNYENSATWFTNTDKLIHWLNQDGRVNAFYSTPSIYAEAKLAANKTYTLNPADLMPYADGPHAYWTGYFTSRAALKGYIRDSSAYFQAAKQIQALSGGATDTGPTNPLYRLERSMGVVQHHDAVAGTSKQAVAYDYARRLAWGRQDADVMLSTAFGKLTGYATAAYVGCDLANVTICPALEGGQPTIVVLYNSQGQARPAAPVLLPVGLPAGITTYAVFDNKAAPVTAQLVPLSPSDTQLRGEYYNYTSTANVQWLAFQAALPAGGYSAYFVQPGATAADAPSTHASVVHHMKVGAGLRSVTNKKGKAATLGLRGDQTITNGMVTITIDGSTGQVNHYANANTNVNMRLAQTWAWYNASVGNHEDGQASGAYIFRPNVSAAFPVAEGPVAVTLVTGPVINEARQSFASWLFQTVRLWAGAPSVDFEYTVGPIPFADGLGKEIVTMYSTDLVTNGTWWTDSNGRDSNKRIFNYRPQWNLTVEEPAAGNYYPVNAFIYTKDVTTGNTLTVCNDRSQGGASLADGEVELMVHRRLQHDDGRGVGEPLNETGLDGNGLIIRGVHRLFLDPPAAQAANRRNALNDLMYKPLLRYAPLGSYTPATWTAAFKAQAAGLATPLPANLHLVTVHSWAPKTLLIRLAHSYETGEDPVLSQPASADLATLLSGGGITLASCTEMTLTGNQPLVNAPKTTYSITGGPTVTLPVIPAAPSGPGLTVTLNPMEIRTFMCTAA